MTLPTAIGELKCVQSTFEMVIKTKLTGTLEKSVAATIGHLLRYLALRFEREGELLFNEIAMLRPCSVA